VSGEIRRISTDSRRIEPGDLFIPLVGEHFDGHDYIGMALEAGAAAALTMRDMADARCIRVNDTLQALQGIAASYRQIFDVKVTAITGSSGKTTTKEMTAAALGARLNVLKTEGNLNNTIGVPLSVLRMEDWHEAAVFEMGMNHFGEIAVCTRVARPEVALISNIGAAHIEYLGSREGILRAKLEILEGLSPGGVAIINGDEPMLWERRGTLGCRTVCFGMENTDCDIYAAKTRESEGRNHYTFCFEGRAYESTLRLPGRHNVMNALSAIAVAAEYGIAPEVAAEALSRYESEAMRQHMFEWQGVSVIDDSYNANPDSMRAALSVLAGKRCAGKRIAVLGAMKELGSFAEEAHYNLGITLAASADAAFLLGGACRHMMEGARNAGMKDVSLFESREAIAEALRRRVRPGDALLVKGSRGYRMEEVLRQFMDKGARA
ncbi:UDP-N-acetylmuramoyl-tripeptide--D-alanyl-D-alanine ligase, partial [Oscillospiraceae bacterium OttesenSCG-928-F05]|nr:UDP-N-acetylmuramoyl-tripeptide--D-alanyl-D-alanine ligase [Oscillospiraceae bacterium OttesenSCG-928-F05]